jgi:serine protease Do
MRAKHGIVALAAWIAIPAAAQTLAPDQLFDRVSPSVWSVKTYTDDEKLITSASGIVVAPGRIVTSCQVLARARQVRLRRGNAIFEAKLEFPDVERDLCQLEAVGLDAPAAPIGSARDLRPGQRLYVVGFAHGSAQSIGEGLVSEISEEGTPKERLLTTIPATDGLRGAGVFDGQGRLVGIVTGSPKGAAAVVAAVPAKWLADVPARGKAALAARAQRAATADASSPEGLPVPGTQWVYAFNERIFSKGQVNITVRVLRADPSIVEEVVTSDSGSAKELRRVISHRVPSFDEYVIRPGSAFVELAPYLMTAAEQKAPSEFQNPSGYPVGSSALPGWETRVIQIGWETTVVTAGRFRTFRIKAIGKRVAPIGGRGNAYDSKFELDLWYSPDVKRIVRLEHKSWAADGYFPKPSKHDVVELVSFRPPS